MLNNLSGNDFSPVQKLKSEPKEVLILLDDGLFVYQTFAWYLPSPVYITLKHDFWGYGWTPTVAMTRYHGTYARVHEYNSASCFNRRSLNLTPCVFPMFLV